MATTVNVNAVNYQGAAVAEYLLKCMNGNKTGAAGVRFLDSIKDKVILKYLDATNLLVPATCDYSPNGTVTASACQYQIKEVQSEVEICWSDLVQLFGSDSLTAGVNNGDVNQIVDFSTSLIDIMVGKIGESVDDMLWNGVATTGTTVSDLFDGYIELLANGSGCPSESGNNITGTSSSALTTSNIIAQFGRVYENAPSCVMGKPEAELVFFVSPKTKALLKLAYSAFENIMPLGTIGSTFLGIEVVAIPAIGDDIIILGERKNFVIMTDLFSDFNQISVLDERPKYNYVVFILRAKLVAGIGFPSEVTTWGLA
jgi:hypothetical protein